MISLRSSLAGSVLALVWISSCCCPDEKRSAPAASALEVRAVAAFVEGQKDPLHAAWLRAAIVAPAKGPAGERVRLAHAVFYGDAGDKTAAQLEQDSNRLGVLPDDAGQAGASSFEPTVWLSAWMKKELSAKPTEFTLLVCSTLEFEGPSGTTTRTDKLLRHFRSLTLTNRTDGTTGGGNNSTTSSVTATGCFFSTQHVALYDTTIGYAPPPTGFHVASITVSTGYDEASATTLTVLRNPNPANSPAKLKLRGPWDGLSNTWHMYVDVVYAPDSGSGTYGPEHHDVMFTGMLFNAGTIVVGEE